MILSKLPKLFVYSLALSLGLGCSSGSDQAGNNQNAGQPSGSEDAEESRKENKGKKSSSKGSSKKDKNGEPDDSRSADSDDLGDSDGTPSSSGTKAPPSSDKPATASGVEMNGTSRPDFLGFVTGSHKEGTIYGYALMRDDASAVARVSAYLGGPRNSGGKKIGESIADKGGFAGGFQGNHAFRFSVPADLYQNGQSFQVHMYEVGGSELQNSPITVTAYRPKGAALFEQNKASFSACIGCHGETDYGTWFDRLVSPPPGQGGSATGNNLYRRASGNGHPAGNFCGGGGLCNFLSQWWTTEFGS